ncbi:hypothetical protein CEXT_284761 [Caerostris extrusa]|uniref:Uncharacterized protein n=1 Tax=Caerostris extrusa TaxID=172846 RepID=A0AAV4QD46_CAEEX|nr:hypothetical protein CEXT_284761 [Caerostris extrusa]
MCSMGKLIAVRSCDEILNLYVKPNTGSIGNEFILICDYVRSYGTRFVDEYIEGHGVQIWSEFNDQFDLLILFP